MHKGKNIKLDRQTTLCSMDGELKRRVSSASIDQLKNMVLQPGFIVCAVLVVVAAVVLITHTAPRYGSRIVLVYIAICSSLGSFILIQLNSIVRWIRSTPRW
ncbi:hypothetical protein ACOMHN_031929 [Nucella lapillus]